MLSLSSFFVVARRHSQPAEAWFLSSNPMSGNQASLKMSCRINATLSRVLELAGTPHRDGALADVYTDVIQ